MHEEEEDDDSRLSVGKEGRYTAVQQPVGETRWWLIATQFSPPLPTQNVYEYRRT